METAMWNQRWALTCVLLAACAGDSGDSADGGADAGPSSSGTSSADSSATVSDASVGPSSAGSSSSGGSETEDPPDETGSCEGQDLLARPSDPAQRGPWPVGVRTVEVTGLSLPTEVWYPATPGSDGGQSAVDYDLRQWLPPSQREVIPDADNPLQTCDCYRELPLDDAHGPYPVVVFVHGTAAWRAQSLSLVTHLASRGFVVVSSDHPGLFLADNLSLACPDPATGQQDLRADEDALMTALAGAQGDLAFLAGRIDLERVGVTGHSAGGTAVAQFSGDPGVQVAIPLASGQPTAGAGVSTLFMGGLSDGVVAYSNTQSGYAQSPAPKRIVGLSNAGHLAFSDICEIANDSGQNILEVATEYGICGAQFAGLLFDCNPEFLPADIAREIVAFSATAVLEDVLHCSGQAAAHFAQLQARFPQVGEFEAEL